ncbi:MAG: hypothetical protein WBG54_13990 [Acidobacteriaceae bacterium]
MSATGDKRRRSDLDLFVLALVADGVSTPYRMQIDAGLSPGATIPALRRLVQSGLALQGKPGPRGRTEHRITAAGRRRLNSGWSDLIEGGPTGDLDADLRVALLAVFVGGDRAAASDFLLRAAALRTPGPAKKDNTDEPTSLPPLALWYRRLRASSARALRAGESSAASAMAKSLPRFERPKRIRSRVQP